MKTDYHERKENRIQRFIELAGKNLRLSQAGYDRAKSIGSCIPMGQPILVGHHSEKRHRAAINKIDQGMRQSVECSKKANYYEERAAAAESNHAISSDNPDALRLLQEKLEKLQGWQEMMKAINKIIKGKKQSEVEKVTALVGLGMKEEQAIRLLSPDHFNRIGIPSYKLTNNNGNMTRIKQRIQQLERLEQMEEKEIEIGPVKILVSPEKNRVQIFFPGKPSEEVRKELKDNGFVWSPMEGAWQRKVSSWAEREAKSIVKKHYL